MVWRYDPIIISNRTGFDDHRARFRKIAARLAGRTRRVVISIVDAYRKTRRNVQELETEGLVVDWEAGEREEMLDLLTDMKVAATANGMEIQACAKPRSYLAQGIGPARCIDPALLESALGIAPAREKHRGQRELCGCVTSRDIGDIDTCAHGCTYCYATRRADVALTRYREHDPEAAGLSGALPLPDGAMDGGQGRLFDPE